MVTLPRSGTGRNSPLGPVEILQIDGDERVAWTLPREMVNAAFKFTGSGARMSSTFGKYN